jgi:NAD(P)-dependent dehydrogenase (short-subunit alcohol dehydrogenase family)
MNITSMGGFQGSSKFPGLSAYSASKAALGNLTECLAEELKEENVAVNALALGRRSNRNAGGGLPRLRAADAFRADGAFYC